jgi:hypothetical protein
MIFAREISDPLTSLVKKVDETTGKHQAARMGSFVVFCNDAEGLEKRLKVVAEKEALKNIVLAIDNPAGPAEFKVAKQADVTVVLYVELKVVANYAFAKGELKDGDIEKIIADVPKILPKK